MGTLGTIALVVGAVSFLTFVAFFGRLPAFRNTPIASLHRVLWVHIPKSFVWLDNSITGGRLYPSITKLGNYLLYSKHPIVLSLFLGLVAGSAILFLPPTWALLSPINRITISILLPQPFIFTYVCQRSKPDSPLYVSRANIDEQLKQYPFDHVLYHPNNICTTCNLPKPARSKHCTLCGTCVARCDHHCVWVNNCVGRGNYKYFLALLFSTTLLLLHGTYMAYSTLMPQVQALIAKYPSYYLSELSGREDFVGRMLDRLTFGMDLFSTGILIGGLRRAGVGLLAAMTWPLPLGLLSYHVYLVWAGMTTNETGKWSDWREDMADGLVYGGELRRHKPQPDKFRVEPDESGHTDPVTRWPHRSKTLLLRTGDGQPPRLIPDFLRELVVDECNWRQIWNLGDVDNIYDLGFWGNFKEALTN